MKIMAIGDIVGKSGTEYIKNNLPRIKECHGIDLCVANGENSAPGNGITRRIADELIYCGVDVITLGNHVFDKREILGMFEDNMQIIRPINYPPGTPGVGRMMFEVNGVLVGVMNLIGRVFLHPVDCPFRAADAAVEDMKKAGARIIMLDFHAEATSEKLAMGYHLDGRISAMFGTHTHVQTADERIMPRGTAYITDVGMTGPRNSVLGVKPEIVLERFITQIPRRFEASDNESGFNSVVIEFDDDTSAAKSITRVNY